MKRFVAIFVLSCFMFAGIVLSEKDVEIIWLDTKVETVQKVKPKPYFGVMMEAVADTSALGGSKKMGGVRVTEVVKDTPAEAAGIMANDIIVKIGDKEMGNEAKKLTTNFRVNLFEFSAGDNVPITILRDKKMIEMKVQTKMPETVVPSNDKLRPDLENHQDWLTRFMEKTIKKAQLTDVYESVLSSYEVDEMNDDKTRLNDFRYIHRDPLKTHHVVDTLLNNIQSAVGKNKLELDKIIESASQKIDEKQTPERKIFSTNNAVDDLKMLISLAKEAVVLRDKAFAKLTPEELKHLNQYGADMMDKFAEHIYINSIDPKDEKQVERYKNHIKIFEIAQKVDLSSLMKSAQIMAAVSNSVFLRDLEKTLNNAKFPEFNKDVSNGISGEVLYAVEDEKIGKVVVLGKGHNNVRTDVAICIDLGGDDWYFNNSGSADGETKVAMLIDFDGNDYYHSTKPFRQGSGFLGNGMLIDMKGDDDYSGIRFAQGTGYFGTGTLIDFEGNDSYQIQEYGQGIGLYGLGLNIDLNGNDDYRGSYCAQAVGFTKGFGLCLDSKGDDKFYSSGKFQSGYGTEGIYEGFSQGLGIGFRGIASGGFGVFFNIDGKDKYTAGNFSQGCGYYFSIGIFADRGKDDDVYIGSRYTQAAAAHSAMSVFYEEGGNDRYQSFMGVNMSASWDLTYTLFIDYEGNDSYSGGGFSSASVAHNGLCLFLDRKGKDTYDDKCSLGSNVSGNNYHGGYSLGLFVDEGGDKDSYPENEKTKKDNDRMVIGKTWAIFYDMPDKIKE